MSYFHEMRKLIGHRPLVVVGAAVLLTDEQERLLLIHRTDNGCWGIPGGGLEPGESLEETARRETREEIGLELGQLTLFNVFSGPQLFYRYPNGDEVINVSVVYRAQISQAILQLDPAEHDQARFFELSALPESQQISPPVRPVLAAFLASRGIPADML